MSCHIGRTVTKEINLVVCSDLVSHFVNGRLVDSRDLSELNKVADIARPAAEVGCVLIAGMVSHIHAAEHMTELNLVAVWNLKRAELSQSAGGCAVGFVLLCDIIGECCFFGSAEGVPCACGIGGNTASDIVYNQCRRILIRMFADELIGIFFKVGQAFEKIAVFFNRH